jgi:hypothetical protein
MELADMRVNVDGISSILLLMPLDNFKLLTDIQDQSSWLAFMNFCDDSA